MKAKIIREKFGWNPPKWVALPILQAWFEIQDLDMEGRGQWITDLLKGCITGERGEGSFADRLLSEAKAFRDAKAKAGKRGAQRRWGAMRADGTAIAQPRQSHSGAMAEHSAPIANTEQYRNRTVQNRKVNPTMKVIGKSIPYCTTDRTDAHGNPSGFEYGNPTPPPAPATATATAPTPTPTRQQEKPRQPTPTRPPTPPTPTAPAAESKGTRRVLENFKRDPYGYRDNVPASLLPNVAVIFCDECDEARALTAFQRKLQKMGAARFRETFWEFMDTCLTSAPTNRGAALMKRLEVLGSLP